MADVNVTDKVFEEMSNEGKYRVCRGNFEVALGQSTATVQTRLSFIQDLEIECRREQQRQTTTFLNSNNAAEDFSAPGHFHVGAVTAEALYEWKARGW